MGEQTFGEALGHTYSDKWSANDTHHWKQALCCDQVIGYAEHSFDSNTGLCSTCGISGTGTNGVVYTAYTNYASVTGYTGKADVVTIASTYQGLSVTTISANAFNAKAIKQVIIPASVTTIYGGAFADSVLLENITVARFSLPAMLKKKKVYVASIFRLIILPALILALICGAKELINVVFGANINNDILFLLFFAVAMPLGMNTIVFPEAYGGDPSTGASMTLISHTLCVLTIPLIFALLCLIFGPIPVF